jgi:isocitrate dehydrogenase
MTSGDFRTTEKSLVMNRDDSLRIELMHKDGSTTVLRERLDVLAGEVIDGSMMSAAKLDAFLKEQIARAKSEDILFSVHLKATMMKVSDPIIFGHAVTTFFPKVFDEFGDTLAKAGISANDGLASLLKSIQSLPADERVAIERAVREGLNNGPRLAMVDDRNGITNLHVPSDTIVDASMPAMIRTSGHMWGPDGKEADVCRSP